MSPRLEPHDVVYFESPEALRDWFDVGHETATELWIGYHKRSTGRPSLTWSQAVDEALCVGWIDGVRMSIDAERYVQRFTPRRQGSTWSAINVAKIERLTAEGRMRPAGLAAFEARTAATARYSYERALATFTEVELAIFKAHAAAWADWESRPPSYRRAVTHWVASARQPATRERRLASLIEDSAAGRKVGPMRVERNER